MPDLDPGTVALFGWLALCLLLICAVIARGVREEQRKTRAWLAEMERMGRRCPDCRGLGFHLITTSQGRNLAPTCSTCGGDGEITPTRADGDDELEEGMVMEPESSVRRSW